MGSIVDKINYLKQTKSSIYNAIKSKGSDITESTTFRQYADKISALDVSSGTVTDFLNYLDIRKKEILDQLDIQEPALPSQYTKLKEFVLNRPETITYDYCYGFCFPYSVIFDLDFNFSNFSDYKLYESDYSETTFTGSNIGGSYTPNYSKCIKIDNVDYCYLLLGFNKKDTISNLGDLFFRDNANKAVKFGLFVDVPSGLIIDKNVDAIRIYNSIYFDISSRTSIDIEEVSSDKNLNLCAGYFGQFEPTFIKTFNFNKLFTYRPGKSINLFSGNSNQSQSKIEYLELPEIVIPKGCNLSLYCFNVKKIVCPKLTLLNCVRSFDIIYNSDNNNYMFEGNIIMPNTAQSISHEILRGCKYVKGNISSGPVVYSDYNYNYAFSSDLEFIDGNLIIDMRNSDGTRLDKPLSINLNQKYIKNLTVYGSYQLQSLYFENKNGNIFINSLLIDLLNNKTDSNYNSMIRTEDKSLCLINTCNLNIVSINGGKSPTFEMGNNFYVINNCNINFKNYLPSISKNIFTNVKATISILFEDSFPNSNGSYKVVTNLDTYQDVICNANVTIDNKSTFLIDTYQGLRHINGTLNFSTVADSQINNIPIYIGDAGSCNIKANKIGSLNFSYQRNPYIDNSNWDNLNFINNVNITTNRDIEFLCDSYKPFDIRPIVTGDYTLTIKSLGNNVYNLFKLGVNNKNIKLNQTYCLDVYNKLAQLADTLPSGSTNKIVINSSDYDYYSSNLDGAGSWIKTFSDKNWTISK